MVAAMCGGTACKLRESLRSSEWRLFLSVMILEVVMKTTKEKSFIDITEFIIDGFWSKKEAEECMKGGVLYFPYAPLHITKIDLSDVERRLQ
jgi:hypothetical protein